VTERGYTYDVVVVGGGLSGALAALAARRQGARVALLAEGSGMMELSSGCIDLLGATPEGEPVTYPWETLAKLRKPHPYTMMGSTAVEAGLMAFQDICEAMGLHYHATPDRSNQLMVTALGTLRTTYLAAPTVRPLQANRPIWVAGLQGVKDFHPGVVAAGLRQHVPGTSVTWGWVDQPSGPSVTWSRVSTPHTEVAEAAHPIQVARLMDRPEYRSALIRNLVATRPAEAAGGLVLLPGVLGLDHSSAVLSEITAALDMEVGEVPLLSPSLPGLRLSALLWRYLQRQEVDLYLGVLVTGAETDHGHVRAVHAQNAAGAATYRGQAFVLATGGLLGQGLTVADRTLRESIFGLAVEAPEPSSLWAFDELLPASGHPFVRAGIRTDDHLQPEGWRNLYIAGRMLAGYDPYAESCGGGVAVASGWLAGRLAGGETR